MNMRSLAILAAGCLAIASVSRADMITLSDPSFESGFYGAQGTAGSGWFTFGFASGGADVSSDGFWNMTNTHLNAAAYATQIALDDGGSIYQRVTLDAGVEYQFTVGVGSSGAAAKTDAKYSLVFFDSGFTTQLAATTGIATFGTYTFTDSSVTYKPTATGDYFVGARNRGYVPGTGADNAQSTVFFDNARLTVIPEPGTAGLISLVGVVTVLRRRMKIKR